ncbi:peptide chain release factor N(5)-glutamine methyltransferase [Polaribacter sp.]|uniref:peptide chain release factor N(5)-glutamine methyltransferase n=1 Tax=Polaribacter sp. TaxID=1920175 RepID=UPI0025CE9288|nr:peptide chain release factor N(5)-glutamine methyltransferase [Polaribacter sp.]
MTLKEYRSFFTESLLTIYPKTEIETFLYLLIEEYLGLNRIEFAIQPNYEIKEEKIQLLNKGLERLKKEEPIQYIMGHTEFFGYSFIVNKNTLIPRPETEELVAWVLNEIEKPTLHQRKINYILDIGTGSGCIPISIAKENKNTNLTAIDISEEALKTAQKNAKKNKVTIQFTKANILTEAKLDKQYDIIISNPPYVRNLEKKEIKNNVLLNEPHLALFVENKNPLIFYDKIADLAKQYLTKKGKLFFEINQYLGEETKQLLIRKGFNNIELRKDIFKNDRMIKATL